MDTTGMRKIKYKKPNDSFIFTNRSRGEKVVYAIISCIFALYAFTLIYPFFWMIINSLKSGVQYTLDLSTGKPFAFPEVWEFSNYSYAMGKLKYHGTGLIGMFSNSVWISATNVILGTMGAAAFAYLMSRFKFRGRGLIYGIVIFTMTAPIVGATGSRFKLISDLHLYDTVAYVFISSYNPLGLGFMVFYGFFKGISQSYAEAVYMDGGGEWTVFLRIMLPQALPCIFSVGIIGFIGSWNDYMSFILYLPSFPTLASGIYYIKTDLLRTGRDPIVYAALLISIIPILVLFASFSDLIMKNMTVGGLKG